MRDTAESWLICAGSRQDVLRRILWRVQMVKKACVAQSELKHWSDQPVWQLSADCRASAHLSSRSTAHFPHIRHIMNFWWKHELSADADAQTHVQKQVTRVHQVVLLKGSPSKQRVAGKNHVWPLGNPLHCMKDMCSETQTMIVFSLYSLSVLTSLESVLCYIYHQQLLV